ncbi:type VII toxin-antitoxin system HepT family RNase toxin [Ruania zhangjianzhongii]|uniref:type VII toxin-antitoxin system HepT family RNase toxin n=1 Tax=Ruania zhangjianzhongii TaxID=2603206 RepID=UPI0011CC4B93|nr:DUF86 domain-containing protein [Ruania zhangjianzhongii]
MVDLLRIQRLLRGITEELSFLDGEARAGAERRSDPIWLRGVKYSFVAAIEAGVDTAQHLCASAGWGPPADNGDAMRLLGEHGVLEPELAVGLRQAVGFRNVLVHDYADVDDAIVVARLEDLSHLRQFVSAVARYVVGEERRTESD